MPPPTKKPFSIPAPKRPFALTLPERSVTGQFQWPSTATRLVYVIGSPSPGEIAAKHPYQFVEAAVYRGGLEPTTLCLVEQTGFDNAKIALKDVESKLAPAEVQWITPKNTLVTCLNKLSPGSIRRLIVFSHGLPGIVTLRYGWKGSADYGLKSSEIGSLRKNLFLPDAELEFNSCNTGSYSDDGVLAQNLATHLDRPVKAWTGRTSYAEVNNGSGDGDTSIKASDANRGGSRWTLGWDTTELWRQNIQGRGVPRLATYTPLDEFRSSFTLSAAIPEGEHALCAATGTTLEITVENSRYVSTSFYTPSGTFFITPLRRDPALFDADESLVSRPFTVGKRQTQTWTGLTGGWYYLRFEKGNASPLLDYETISGSLLARIKR